MDRGHGLSILFAALALPVACGCASPSSMLAGRGPTAQVNNERLMRIAETFEDQGQYRKAKELYARIANSSPQNGEARERFELIARLERENKLPTAEELRALALKGERHKGVGAGTATGRAALAAAAKARAEQKVAKAAVPAPQKQVARIPEETIPPLLPADEEVEPQVTASDLAANAIRADELETTELVEQSRANDVGAKTQAIRELAKRGPEARLGLQAVRGSLNDEHPVVRACAAEAVWRISGETAEAVPVLVAVLQGSDISARELAAFVLGRIGPDGAAAVPDLKRLLQLNEGSTREELLGRVHLVEAVARVELGNEAAVQELIAILQTENESADRSVRLLAALALAELPQGAEGTIQAALNDAAASENPQIREVAEVALALRTTGEAPQITPASGTEDDSEDLGILEE